MNFPFDADRQQAESRAMYRFLGRSVLAGAAIGLAITGGMVGLGLATLAVPAAGAATAMAMTFGLFGGIVGLSGIASDMHLPAVQKELDAQEQKETARGHFVHALSVAEREISSTFRRSVSPTTSAVTAEEKPQYSKPAKLPRLNV